MHSLVDDVFRSVVLQLLQTKHRSQSSKSLRPASWLKWKRSYRRPPAVLYNQSCHTCRPTTFSIISTQFYFMLHGLFAQQFMLNMSILRTVHKYIINSCQEYFLATAYTQDKDLCDTHTHTVSPHGRQASQHILSQSSSQAIGCSRKGIRYKNTPEYMARLILPPSVWLLQAC